MTEEERTNQSSQTKFLQVAVNIILGVAILFVTRILTKSLHIPGILGAVIQLTLFTLLTYYGIRVLAKRSELGMSGCYVTRPTFTSPGVLTGFLMPMAAVCILLLLPGTMSYHPLSADYAAAVFIPAVISSVLGSGINEELVFRGYLLKTVEQSYGKKAAVLSTSLIFGLFHLLNRPLPLLDALLFLAYTTSLGILFCVLTLKSGNIWNGVFAHGFVNLWCAVVAFGANPGLNSPFSYVFSEGLPVWLTGGTASASILYTAVIWFFIFRARKDRDDPMDVKYATRQLDKHR